MPDQLSKINIQFQPIEEYNYKNTTSKTDLWICRDIR